MDKLSLIYDMVKELRDQQLEDHDILLKHQQMSESNKKRLDIVETKAFLVNWKQLGAFTGIISSIAAIVYYISRVI